MENQDFNTHKKEMLLYIIHKKNDEDGSLLVEATKSHKDLVKPADKNQRRKDSQQKGKKFNIIKDGVQVQVSQKKKHQVL